MAPAIVTVTPNESVDLVLRQFGPSTREELGVDLVADTAGGKGHNVARFWASAVCEQDAPWPPDRTRIGALLEALDLR